MTEGRLRLEAVVTGRVQAVGFRWFVESRASELGLSGWVRNRPGGAVECVAEGPRPALEELLVDLRSGPPGAAVSEVEASWQAARGGLDGFRIAG